MSNWTHQVTALSNPAQFEQELEDTKALMAQFVANGNWTQDAADRRIDQAEKAVVEARKGERFVFSRHRSLSAALKSVTEANEFNRVIPGSAQVEEL